MEDQLTNFSVDLRRYFDDPGSVTRRVGAEFAARLHRFLHHMPLQAKVTFWSTTSDEATDPASDLCPQGQLMQVFEAVLTQGLHQVRRDLLDTFSNLNTDQEDPWQPLIDQFLQPMSRLDKFSRVMQACLVPVRSWLDTGVLIGHRTLCLSDQIRQSCLDQLLKLVAHTVSIAIFKTLHRREGAWLSSDLAPVLQYLSIMQQYQHFQTYLSKSGYQDTTYEKWEDIDGQNGGSELFNLQVVFVDPYIECLKQFYQPLLDPFDAHLVTRRIGVWLMKEESLAVECDIAGFRDSVVNCLLQVAVKAHLKSFGEAVLELMRQNDCAGLSEYFRVMVMVENGMEHLLEVLRGFVKAQMQQMFDHIRAEFESLDPNSAKATSMYIDGCAAQMRLCRAMIESIELHPSLNRNLLMATVKTGIADVLNSNPLIDAVRHPASSVYPAAALAHHFHRQLRTVSALEADSREAINDLMTMYSLLVDKEAFLVRYHSLLRERLLSDGCDQLCLEAENFALEHFTQLSGWKAIYELKSVLKDFRESEEFNCELRNLPEFQTAQRAVFGSVVPIKFTFVRGYFWRMSAETVRLPPQLSGIVGLAIGAYQSNHTGRAVTLAYSHGSGLLAFSPPQGDGEVMLRCSTAILILLMNFNESDCLTESDLRDLTGIPVSEVKFYLLNLVRAGLLLVGGEGGELFSVNDSFQSNAKLVNLMVSQQQHSQKQRRRLEKQDQRMKEKRVQCAIVAVMKQVRTLARSDLYHMVQSRLPSTSLHPSFFSEQLGYLISGGYIRVAVEAADDTGESVIEYIP